LEENKEAIAVLEINPLSKGHVLIVPRKHGEVEKIPAGVFGLAKKVAVRIKKKFSPKEIRISSQNLFGHSLVEVLPIYGDEKERKKASKEELLILQDSLKYVKRERKKKTSTEKMIEKRAVLPVLKRRRP